jgi:hypothetical protein
VTATTTRPEREAEAQPEAKARTWDPTVLVIILATVVAALVLVAWMVATGKVELPLAGLKWQAAPVVAAWLWRAGR